MLKVEDGCVNFCTYCIIPYARGPIRSLSISEAEEQCRRLGEEGYREVVLTGIEISSWGGERKDGMTLIDLLEAVCRALPRRYPGAAGEPGAPDHHGGVLPPGGGPPQPLPSLPSVHAERMRRVLRRMNRKYDTERYYQSVELLREYFDRPGITTDLIVGFPGETEEEFQETLAFVEKCAFSAMHIFPYSRRAGTPAAAMPGQVPNVVKEERAHRAGELARRLEEAYLEQWVGGTLPVLFEEERDGLWRGHAPNYMEVFAPGEGLHNVEKRVKITQRSGNHLMGAV